MNERVGIAGVGLMGHGIARNVLKHGYGLTVLEHPGNQPLDELKGGGATTVSTAKALAAECDVLILCVTGSPEVEAVLCGTGGALEGLRQGTIVIDCSTAVPASSVRMAEAVRDAGGHFIDAPMTRTAQHAHEGRLNLLVGGDKAVIEGITPLLHAFAENIAYAGGVGAGHRLKLLHNFVSLGSMALIAEAAACAARSGIEPDVFIEVLAGGGGAGVALDRLKPTILDPNGTPVQFFMANALKDLRYYTTMADDTRAEHLIADAVSNTLDAAVKQGGARAMVSDLVALLSQRDADTPRQ